MSSCASHPMCMYSVSRSSSCRTGSISTHRPSAPAAAQLIAPRPHLVCPRLCKLANRAATPEVAGWGAGYQADGTAALRTCMTGTTAPSGAQVQRPHGVTEGMGDTELLDHVGHEAHYLEARPRDVLIVRTLA